MLWPLRVSYGEFEPSKKIQNHIPWKEAVYLSFFRWKSIAISFFADLHLFSYQFQKLRPFVSLLKKTNSSIFERRIESVFAMSQLILQLQSFQMVTFCQMMIPLQIASHSLILDFVYAVLFWAKKGSEITLCLICSKSCFKITLIFHCSYKARGLRRKNKEPLTRYCAIKCVRLFLRLILWFWYYQYKVARMLSDSSAGLQKKSSFQTTWKQIDTNMEFKIPSSSLRPKE